MEDNGKRVCGLDPKICHNSVVLILGTLPGKQSLKDGSYYADKSKNHFWRILFKACNTEQSTETEDRLLEKYRIALWDILKSADRDTANDKDIINEKPNDLPRLLADYPNIQLLIFHSEKAYKFFRQYYKNTTIPYIRVASPSGQNTMSIDEKVSEWRSALSCVIPELRLEERLEWKSTPTI